MAKKRVLVVDDDETIRSLVLYSLSEVGYEVFLARNGLDALKLMESHPVDMILLDMRMPIMSGWEFADALRTKPAEGRPSSPSQQPSMRPIGPRTSKPTAIWQSLLTSTNYPMSCAKRLARRRLRRHDRCPIALPLSPAGGTLADWQWPSVITVHRL
jgi:CheY-like chemotaxis protein